MQDNILNHYVFSVQREREREGSKAVVTIFYVFFFFFLGRVGGISSMLFASIVSLSENQGHGNFFPPPKLVVTCN